MPYEFKARFPFDHAVTLVQLIRSGEARFSEVLIQIGAVTGELGALLEDGIPSVTLSQQDRLQIESADSVEACLEKLEPLVSSSSALTADDEDQFDPTPWIPLILKLIELWLNRNR